MRRPRRTRPFLRTSCRGHTEPCPACQQREVRASGEGLADGGQPGGLSEGAATIVRMRWNRWTALGVLLLAGSAFPLARHYLVTYPEEIRQVDLQVYRQGARALVDGFPLYRLRTDAPQFLPFTYPPFAALTALPLLLAPFGAMVWIWTVLQFALLWYAVGVAFAPLLRRFEGRFEGRAGGQAGGRFGSRVGLVQGLIAGAAVWFLPVAEGIRFGQVNCVIVALCLWDLTRGPTRAGGGSGVGVALGAAVKLTPGVFWLHWVVSRRWRALVTSLVTVAAVTVLTFVVLPEASASYWTDALFDPGRLGPNAGTSNQSLRGVLLRIGPGPGWPATLLWLVCALLVLAGGLWLSRRLAAAGEPVAVVAAVGLVAYLVSPVSWVHHLWWGVVVIGALLGDGRDRRRVAAAGASAVLLWCRLPWWGANLLAGDAVPEFVARVVQNSYAELSVVWLVLLWLLVARLAATPETPSRRPEVVDTLGG